MIFFSWKLFFVISVLYSDASKIDESSHQREICDCQALSVNEDQMRRHSCPNECIAAAAKIKKPNLMRKLMEAGLMPSMESLYLAIEYKNIPIIRLLLNHPGLPVENFEAKYFRLLDEQPEITRLLLADGRAFTDRYWKALFPDKFGGNNSGNVDDGWNQLPMHILGFSIELFLELSYPGTFRCTILNIPYNIQPKDFDMLMTRARRNPEARNLLQMRKLHSLNHAVDIAKIPQISLQAKFYLSVVMMKGLFPAQGMADAIRLFGLLLKVCKYIPLEIKKEIALGALWMADADPWQADQSDSVEGALELPLILD